MAEPKYHRVLLKLSGEALVGENGDALSSEVLEFYAQEIISILSVGAQVAVVLGGGNIWRGNRASARRMDTAQSHYMGMLATIINALALQDALEGRGVVTRAMTAIKMDEVAEPYIHRRAIRHLEKGRVIILAGGTGRPYFTTDSAAALRAAEIHAEVILMAKNGVDGVYTADPKRDPSATRFDFITYMDALQRGLAVMDSTALTFCMDNKIPIIVFDPMRSGNIARIVNGERVGTLVSDSAAI
ncbi:MAG TPA: UMP kinase [Kouleothrix sp.]|uniref:UMP kinase n=1 Tax=Kouleothrix sp. TaxID=2779161 RepID=UPI002CA96329|nr:UMP kinase [Kouleothrix sp.]HRC74083.1 UMP kinase [Kouleothrix sp.]